MFNDRSSALSLLQTRRSGKPRDMVEPGPDAAQLDAILSVAIRTPDHGKLAPWRFLVIAKDKRSALAALLLDAYRVDKPEAGRLEIEAIEQFAHQAPTLVVAFAKPARASHIPLWEQELSAGAACMNLLTAAHASGFVGSWLTGWATYSTAVREGLGGTADEKIAGFIFIGTPSRPLEERPRPERSSVIAEWNP